MKKYFKLDKTINIEKLINSKNNVCQAKGFELSAIQNLKKTEYDLAVENFKKSEEILLKTDCEKDLLQNTYKYWAQLFYTKGDFGEAQRYSLKLLSVVESTKDYYEIAGAYTMVAQLYNQTGRAEKGINYTRKAAKLFNKINDLDEKLDIVSKLSKRYLWHYQDIKVKTSLDSSEIFAKIELKLAKKLNDKMQLSESYNSLQGIEWEKENYKLALVYLDSSFAITAKNDYTNLATNYYDRADLLSELGQHKKALEMADSAVSYYKKTDSKSYLADAYENMAKIAQKAGDFKTAYEKREMGRAIIDSVRNVEKTKQVTELEQKYNQSKNEKTIKELAQQKQIYGLLALAGLLGFGAFIFYMRQQSLKNKQKVMETEQRLNRARMNPHFFFNALSSLQTFALEGNDGKSMAINLSKFSNIMRETLESTYKDYISLEQEIDFLTEYLEIQKMRFPKKYEYKISLSTDIEADELVIPSMILQPFVENSIEHGFNGINYLGKLSINFSRNEQNLLVILKDNGKGLFPKKEVDLHHISRASQIIKDRIFLLNIKLKTNASFEIVNNTNETGVIVTIKLPLLDKSYLKNDTV
jgi:tetratricopeptide (TPR) repeat protein